MATPEFTLAEFDAALDAVGIEEGDVVIVHSSILHLGLLSDCNPRQMSDRLIDTFVDRLGASGTLTGLAPCYDYSNNAAPFDTRTSSVAKEIGVFNAALAARVDAERSANPVFSLAGIGAAVSEICVGSNASAFGAGSAWDHAVKLGAKVVMLGASFQRFTLVRYIEQLAGVPYLFVKLFRTPISRNGVELDMPVTALLRYAHMPLEYDLSRFETRLSDLGLVRTTELGGGAVSAIPAKKAVDAGIEALNEDLHYFLRVPPKYPDGELPVK